MIMIMIWYDTIYDMIWYAGDQKEEDNYDMIWTDIITLFCLPTCAHNICTTKTNIYIEERNANNQQNQSGNIFIAHIFSDEMRLPRWDYPIRFPDVTTPNH